MTPKTMTKVGFVGLGIMGRPMAENLIRAGHELYLASRSGVPENLVEMGGKACGTPREVALAAEIQEVAATLPPSPRHCRRRSCGCRSWSASG